MPSGAQKKGEGHASPPGFRPRKHDEKRKTKGNEKAKRERKRTEGESEERTKGNRKVDKLEKAKARENGKNGLKQSEDRSSCVNLTSWIEVNRSSVSASLSCPSLSPSNERPPMSEQPTTT